MPSESSASSEPTEASESAVPPQDGVTENAAAGRFELRISGEIVSFATYSENGSNIVVPHVETAPEHRGNGYAAKLVEGTLAIVRATERTITPLCPFAAAHIRDNPQHHDLLGR